MNIGKTFAIALLSALAFSTLTGCAGSAQSGSSAAMAKQVKDDRALASLKEMSDTLAKADSMSFRADSAVAIASPTQQWVHVFGVSLVTLQRPDKLYVESGGEM